MASEQKNDFKDLECYDCDKLPNPGDKIYSCTFAENPDPDVDENLDENDLDDYARYLCEKCFKDDPFCIDVGDSKLYYQFDPLLTKLFARMNHFQCNFSGNGCQEEFHAQKAHEKACIYQKVECPTMNCEEVVIFKDVDVHLDQEHKMEKVNKEWNFEGTKEELLEVMCCLSSYDRQFYPQFYVKGNRLYFKIIMLGTKESAISFKVYLTFFHENGFRFTIEDQVYPITENDKEQDFLIVKLKKVVEYFDVKTFEYKKQAKIQFDLKVVNEKLDEIAKDKKNSVESGNFKDPKLLKQ